MYTYQWLCGKVCRFSSALFLSLFKKESSLSFPRLRILGIGVFGLAFLLIFILILGGQLALTSQLENSGKDTEQYSCKSHSSKFLLVVFHTVLCSVVFGSSECMVDRR